MVHIWRFAAKRGHHFGKRCVTMVARHRTRVVLSKTNIFIYFQHCRNIVGPTGIAAGDGFQDGGVSLLDVRFSDDILVFAKSFEEIGRVLEMLAGALRQVGFVPNAGKKIQRCRANIQQSPMSRAVTFLEGNR